MRRRLEALAVLVGVPLVAAALVLSGLLIGNEDSTDDRWPWVPAGGLLAVGLLVWAWGRRRRGWGVRALVVAAGAMVLGVVWCYALVIVLLAFAPSDASTCPGSRIYC